MTPGTDRRRPRAWVLSLAALAAATAAMLATRGRLEPAHVTLIYLLIVLVGSGAGGRTLGLTLAGLAFLAFDWFFLPPYGTLIVANPLDWLVLLAFLATSIVAAQLLARAEHRADEARRRTAEVRDLAALGAETLNAGRGEEALAAIAEVIRETLRVERCAIYAGHSAEMRLAASAPATDRAAAVAANSLLVWVAEHGAPALELLDGTSRVGAEAAADSAWPDTRDARVLVLPLRVRDRTVGVLHIEDQRGIALAAGGREFLQALGFYAALGVERLRLTSEAEHAAAFREADRLKSALLAAVSHDLRTPLTTIKGLAHAIAEEGAARRDPRANAIEEEADRLGRAVGDLLELSRIAGGAVVLQPSINTADDLIGAALQRVSGIAHGRELRVVRAAGDPLLAGRFDFVHALRALGNLLENALKYAPGSSPIEIAARTEGPMLVLEVADRGPGIPERERERIFEPFYRTPDRPADTGGTGLGLTIARGLAEAQGGSVAFRTRAGGGNIFELRLPGAEVPAA